MLGMFFEGGRAPLLTPKGALPPSNSPHPPKRVLPGGCKGVVSRRWSRICSVPRRHGGKSVGTVGLCRHAERYCPLKRTISPMPPGDGAVRRRLAGYDGGKQTGINVSGGGGTGEGDLFKGHLPPQNPASPMPPGDGTVRRRPAGYDGGKQTGINVSGGGDTGEGDLFKGHLPPQNPASPMPPGDGAVRRRLAGYDGGKLTRINVSGGGGTGEGDLSKGHLSPQNPASSPSRERKDICVSSFAACGVRRI